MILPSYVTDTTVFLLVIALACFLTGISKGGLGGTMGVLITPLVALVIPINQSLGLVLLIFMLGDLFALVVHWRRWESKDIWILLAGGLAGVTLGTFVLISVSPVVLRKGLGILVMLFMAYRLLERYIFGALHYIIRPWHGLLAGSVAGFTSTLANSGGPPIIVYLLMRRLDPATFVATSVLFFAILNWIKVPYYYYAGVFDFELVLRLIWLVPLVPLGAWVGKRMVNRIDKKLFEGIITALLLITGVLLLVK